MRHFSYLSELVAAAETEKRSLAEILIEYEVEKSQRTHDEVYADMDECLGVMIKAVETGQADERKSVSGMVGGDAAKFAAYINKEGILGHMANKAILYALAVSEVNARMGRIVASPTAGSCGIMPGALLAAGEGLGAPREKLVAALFTAAGIGLIINEHASLAGASGGCQAECGSASAMAAAAVTELAGGTPQQSADAAALAMKSILGMVCDPVAGLVEVPCVKRNAFGAVQALIATEMALAGIRSVIPVDEVIQASYEIGCLLPRSLKETSEAGLARTPTAQRIEQQLYGNK